MSTTNNWTRIPTPLITQAFNKAFPALNDLGTESGKKVLSRSPASLLIGDNYPTLRDRSLVRTKICSYLGAFTVFMFGAFCHHMHLIKHDLDPTICAIFCILAGYFIGGAIGLLWTEGLMQQFPRVDTQEGAAA